MVRLVFETSMFNVIENDMIETFSLKSKNQILFNQSNRADTLYHVTYRTGILAALRSRLTDSIIGVMITASHNPEDDNGLKIIEPDGSMLIQSWENLATKIANVSDDNLEQCIADMIKELNINMKDTMAKVYLARDTRMSSVSLSMALIDGIKTCYGEYKDFGLLTTPQLHYIVRCANSNGQYGEPSEQGYYKKLSNAFLRLTENSTKKLNVIVDCANGVGANKMILMAQYLTEKITFDLVNIGDGILNHGCGADFVKVNQRQPDSIELKSNQHYASFDGDADRIVFYYLNNQDNKFHLLDGDKIAVLVAKFLKQLLNAANLNEIEIMVVQTAYANGNSTKYIQDTLQLISDCVPTGVKHLHHRALQSEIGIYFEANGHGTILFSSNVQKRIAECTNENAKKLLHFIDLVNQVWLIQIQKLKYLFIYQFS